MRVEAFLVYEPREGFLYRLHPLTKVTMMFVFSILCFAFSLKGNMLLLIFTVFFLYLSKLSLGKIMNQLKSIYFFLMLAVLGNMFAVPGEKIFSLFGVAATMEGLSAGLLVALRFINLLLISLMTSLTTSHTELAAATEKILQPLKLLKVNVAELAFIIALSIRAVSLIIKEVVELRKLYQAKGVLKPKMAFKDRIAISYYFLVPLLLLTLRRSEEVAFALYVRGYNPERKRIFLDKRHFSLYDLIFVLVSAVVVALAFFLGG